MKNKTIVAKPIVRAGIRVALGLICSLGLTSQAAAQTGSFSSITSAFDQYRQKALQEKLYLHLDRPVYACGETMWFSIYDVDGTQHRPLDISKVAYVEVLDAAQKPVLQAKVALQDGKGKGSFSLPVELGSGNYSVRAYTNWMKNYSPEFYFEQPVTIVNTFRKVDPQPAEQAKGYTVQFFPEGGHLVAGVPNKVAFKALSELSGKGVNFTGELQDERGQKVLDFAPHKFGMGHFTFTPAPGKKYTAVIKLNETQGFTTPLPQVQEQGYALQLEDADAEKLKITVRQQNRPGDQVFLLGHARQIIGYSERATVNNGAAVFIVDKKQLPDGITHFTVFNAGQQPVCERLYFKAPTHTLDLKIATDKPQYTTRDKVTLDILAQANGAKDTPANLSMAVYKVDSLQGAPAQTIESYLWLTSDLKGTIEEPGYYFSGFGASDRQAMDNLMLTHGWSRFTWTDVLAEKPAPFAYVPEYNGHLITGKVTHKVSGEAAPGILTFLASPGKNIRLYNSTSAPDGTIRYEVKDFFDAKDIIIQSNYTKDSTYHFQVFNPFSDKFAKRMVPAPNLASSLQEELTLRHVEVQTQHAYFGNVINRAVTGQADSTTIYGQAPEQYLLDDYKRFKVMEEVLREYVPGIQLRKRRDGFHFMVFDRPNKTIFQENPMVLLDGVPVFDIDKIMAFDPLKVKKLDVVTSRFFNGPQVYDGLVSFITYTGDLAGFEPDPRALMQSYEGLQLQREFYAPVYDTPEHKLSRLADFRNLLHWAPDLKLETGTKAEKSFYTSDQTGTYLVVVQGLTADGKAGSKTYTFTVSQPNL
ncbi:hypothetical protein H7F15_15970 [Pontibacter sp. Tf4]|uniref:hypothetical protein n=1 Tax=Pontibacter sp. Tf4 TaxID=2761620 RepID=UPI0016252A53|nr:hypothetical protein [Pontibacter sp. Tf4]MBB6612543.1 hypothetical protein [Pontibacter sp. Tf4]